MARKVYISSDMSVDERLLEVAEKDSFSALLWPWLLTVFDDWGRSEANAKRLKAKVFPLIGCVKSETIEKALDLFQESGLIELYEVNGKQYMCIPSDKWFKYQTHIRSSKREKDESRLPAPPASNSAQVRASVRSNETEREDARDFTPSPSPSLSLSKEREIAIQTIVRAYEETFGPIKGEPSQLMSLIDYMDKGMEVELIVSAIRKSSTADAPLKYAEKILANQLRKGIKTVEEAIQEAAPTKPKVSEHRPGRYISPDLPPEVKEQVAYELRIRSSGNGTVTSSNSH